MNNWKVIPTIVIATVLIFGAGVFTGGFLVNYVKQAHPKKNSRLEVAPVTNAVAVAPTNVVAGTQIFKPSRSQEILSKDFLQRLDAELRLLPEQHEAIQKIINDGQTQVKKSMNDARLEIRDVLKPDQLRQFDEMVKRPNKKNAGGLNSGLSPEAQVLLLEAQRMKALEAARASLLPPPAALTNAP